MFRIRTYRRSRMAGLSDEYSGKSYLEIFNLYLKKYGKGSTGIMTTPFKRVSGTEYGVNTPIYSASCIKNCSVDIWIDTKYQMIYVDMFDPTGASTHGGVIRFLGDSEYGTPTIRPDYGVKSFEKFSEQLDDVIIDSYQEMVKYSRFANRRHAIKTPSPVTVRKEWHRHNSFRRTIR